MGKYSRYAIGLLLCATATLWSTSMTAEDDFGMTYTLGAEKKFSKRTKLEAEGELRTRNNSRTIERWSLGLRNNGTRWATCGSMTTITRKSPTT